MDINERRDALRARVQQKLSGNEPEEEELVVGVAIELDVSSLQLTDKIGEILSHTVRKTGASPVAIFANLPVNWVVMQHAHRCDKTYR